MKTILKIALLLIVGVLVYNYFLGTTEEKASSEKVFRQVKEVGKSIGELIANEKEKFADGKYDKAFENLERIYENLKVKVTNGNSSDEKSELEDLERRKDELHREKESLEKELKKDNPDQKVLKRGEDLDSALQKLIDETTRLFDQVTAKEESK